MENTSARTTKTSDFATNGIGIVLAAGSNYNRINRVTVSEASPTYGLGMLLSSSNFNIISNSTATSTITGYPIYLTGSSDNLITNTNATGTTHYALGLVTGNHRNTINNCLISSADTTYGSILIYNGGSNNIVANSTVSIGAGSKGIMISTGTTNSNQIINTTISNASASSGTGIYIDSGSNNYIDCQGGSITGANTTATYGVYTNQINTTIKNCNISNFEQALHLTSTAHGGIIQNNNLSTTWTAETDPRYAMAATIRSSNNTITNNTFTNTASNAVGGGLMFYGTSMTNNTATGNTMYAKGGRGMWIYGMSGSTIANNTIITSKDLALNSGGHCIYYDTSTTNNQFINNTCRMTSQYGYFFSGAANTNNTIDCMGAWTTGNNNTIWTTAGAYITSPNTTIRNCNINGFQSGIMLVANALNVMSNNITGGSYNLYGIYLNGVSNSTISANSYTGTNTIYGIYLTGSSSNNLISNTSVTSPSQPFRADASSRNNTINGGTWNSTNQIAIAIYQSYNSTINGITAYSGTGTPNRNPLYIQSASGWTIANSTIRTFSTTDAAAEFYTSATSNTMINNTFISGGGTLLDLVATSGNNTFYWNNFTNTAGLYVNDLNGTNFYNRTINGTSEGNIWYNVISGAINITSLPSIPSSLAYGLYVGNYPSSLIPYNASNGGSKVVGVQDYAPLTIANLSAVINFARYLLLWTDIYNQPSFIGYYYIQFIPNVTGSYCKQYLQAKTTG